MNKRIEINRQARRGWIEQEHAALLLGFDLNVSAVEHYLRIGVLSQRTDGRIKVDDVLTIADASLETLLDKYLPQSRHKAPLHETLRRTLDGCSEEKSFLHQWLRVHRRFAKLIADPAETVTPSVMRLFHQLMTIAKNVNRLGFVIPSSKLLKHTRLDKEGLAIARRSLERLRILAPTERAGSAWSYTFLDPLNLKPFKEDLVAEDETVLNELNPSSWQDL